MMFLTQEQSRPSVAMLVAYLCFIVYGSLVPLHYTPLDFDAAWRHFQQVPMLQLGIESRADWIANGILYIPLGLLAAEWLSLTLSPKARPVALILAFATCCALAIGIEFIQVFFPPRTVSQNDIIAECIGSLAGITLFPFLGQWFRDLFDYQPSTRPGGIALILKAYILAYVAFSLFPYDFLLSAAEITGKLNSDQWGMLFAESEKGRSALYSLVKLAIEVAAAIPLGILVIYRQKAALPSPAIALLPGALLGFGIEFFQFFTYSGSTQGISVVTRALGSYAGALLFLYGRHIDSRHAKAMLIRASFVLLPLYLVGLAALAGWFRNHWENTDSALVSLSKTHFLPFYYQYFSSEAHALTSLVSVAIAFAPIGLFSWVWGWSRLSAAVLAAFLSSIAETSRLFFAETHADPTNPLIAAAGAWGIATLATKLFATGEMPAHANKEAENSFSPINPILATFPVVTLYKGGGFLLVVGLSVYWVANFPVQPLMLAIFLIGCASMAWIKPIFVVALIPAMLPVLDLAPWSGRFFFDEFDILLLLTLTIGYARTKQATTESTKNKLLHLSLGLLAFSFIVSTAKTLIPIPTIDANSFTAYFSPFNSLRITKGLIWALLFWGLYRRLSSKYSTAFTWFAWGTAFGLASTVFIIVREKALFGGLLNFSTDYRVTGPFSAIHTGGAYIECYLSITVPFLIFLSIKAKGWLLRITATLLLLGTTYALMATVSRNGFSAYAIACATAMFATLVGSGNKLRRTAIVVILAGATLAVALPIFNSDYTQKRMSQTTDDLNIRLNHWRESLAMRPDGWLTELLGVGVGRYPATHYWNSREKMHTSTFSLVTEGENKALRISPGSTLYVEQIVDVAPRQHYILSMDIRSSIPNTTAGIALCEKWMLASVHCATWHKTAPSAEPDQWHHLELGIDVEELGSGRWLTRRPVKLSFFTNGNGVFDMDNVRLTSSHGQELIENGDFSREMDNWYFATDEHLAWHMKSLPLAVYFDQGWLGLFAFGAFLAVTLVSAGRMALNGNIASGIALSAIMGFMVVGIFDTVIDAPRFLFLLLFLCLLATHQTKQPNQRMS